MEKPYNLKVGNPLWIKLILIVPTTAVALATLYGMYCNVEGAALGSFFFVLFALLGWKLALSYIQITNEHVTVVTFYGRFRIYWYEIEKICIRTVNERRIPYPAIALIGNNKRVVLMLAYKEMEAWRYFDQQIKQRKIIYETNVNFPITQKNSRIW